MLTISLPPDVEERFSDLARSRGIPVEQFVSEFLVERTPRRPPEELDQESWERAFREMVQRFPRTPILSDEALSRESIYTREDEALGREDL